MDAVHRKASEPAGGPCREDIVDTMVFKPSDVMLVHFRNVDFNYATKGTVSSFYARPTLWVEGIEQLR